jgi:7,8-dihydro-6-hydroxymethylpterin-pyrophosphokinase
VERAFVLVPLADIAPDLSDPRSGLTISSLLDQVDKTGVELFAPASS